MYLDKPHLNQVEAPNNEEGKICETCGEMRYKHIFHYHPDLLQTCKICSRKFQNNLERHMQNHEKSKN